MDKPFSQACENNQSAILAVLKLVFSDTDCVLEIGSGTGQHAVFLGRHLAHLQWRTSDLPQHHAGIRLWLDEANLPNVAAPLTLDVFAETWPVEHTGGVFSANTAQILSWEGVRAMFKGVARILERDGYFALYGPFNYQGAYTSPGNERFDAYLKMHDPNSGVRDFEAVDALARELDLGLVEDYMMPANNRLLVWRKL